ncbi:MAG: PKD domain-containing protein [Saprospiraceae bacterium]|nr:PKD domain-containing protein [Saprospiraceae bacterium]
MSEIGANSFKVSWTPTSSNQNYKITLRNIRTEAIIFETITSQQSHILSPYGYTICEQYEISVLPICSNNQSGVLNKIRFASPIGQGCADFVSDCKVNWPEGMVKFSDKSLNAISWHWDFGNGFTSIAQHPQVSFSQPGVYDVTLTVNNGTHTCTKMELIHILPEILLEQQHLKMIMNILHYLCLIF